MLLRTARIGGLLMGALYVGCAHPPADKPTAEATPPPAATAQDATPRTLTPAAVTPTAETPKVEAPTPAATPVDFARDIRPILESRCQPCHFAGGRMYERLPFDRPETIQQLGPKLFTRIKDDSSQATIRAFLSQAQ